MKLFNSTRIRLERVGIQPLQQFQDSHSISTRLKRAIPLCVVILGVISSSAFFLFKAKNIGEYTFSFYVSITIWFDFFLFAVCNANPIFKFVDDLQFLSQKRMVNTGSNELMLGNLNGKIEKWADMFYSIIVKVTVPGLLIFNFIMSYYLFFTSDLGSDAFTLPYPFWLPFNWRTPCAYLIAFSFQTIYTLCVLHLLSCYLILLFGSCFIMIKFADELKEDFDSLNKSNKSAKNLEVIVEEPEEELSVESEENPKKEENELPKKNPNKHSDEATPEKDPEKKTNGISAKIAKETAERYKRFIEFHTEVKELGRDFSNGFRMMTLGFFVWSLLTCCASLLMIEIKMSHFTDNPADLIQPLLFGFWSFAFIFLLCEFGERVGHRIDELNAMIYQSDWYTLPLEMNRMLPTIILAAQQPIGIRIFGSIRCSRETFNKVFNAGYTNFMILREFIK